MTAKREDVMVTENGVHVLRAGTRVFLKTADICAMTGKSNQWIGQLTSQGTLHKKSTPYGAMYDLAETMKRYCAMLEERAEAKEKAGGDIGDERIKAETSFKKARAIVAMLEAQELQGKMHRSDDVAEFWDDMGYAIRSVLLALPGRVAVDMAEATGTDPAVCADLIRKECVKGMEELRQHRYDPSKFDEKVRGRMNWENFTTGQEDDT